MHAVLLLCLALQTAGYECPMHPEIQSAVPGTCPRCGMALLPRSADRAAGEYRMHLETQWTFPLQARLSMRFEDGRGSRVTSFESVHEQQLHLFIVSRDGKYFDHLHPVRRGDMFEIDVRFREAADYMVFADFVPTGGTPQLLQQMIVTPAAKAGPPSDTAFAAVSGADRTQDGIAVHLEVEELRAGTPALLTFTVADAATGKPIQNLEPLLGATGHLFFANDDLTEAAHSHPLEMDRGPRIRFLTRFALPGSYRVWLQLKRDGRVITVDYALQVPPPR